MRKTLLAVMVLTMIIAASQMAFAFGSEDGENLNDQCDGWFNSIPTDVQSQIVAIKETFKNQLAGLRETIWDLREQRSFDELAAARDEMAALKEQVRAAISEQLSEEHQEAFADRGPGMRRLSRIHTVRGERVHGVE